MPDASSAGRQGELVVGRLHQSGSRAALTGIGLDRTLERSRRLQGAQHLPRAALGGGELQALRQPHRPGDDGREGEADHHRLHHPVGLHEHAPRRQVARQHRILGGQQAVRIGQRVRRRDRSRRPPGSAPSPHRFNRRCVCGRCLVVGAAAGASAAGVSADCPQAATGVTVNAAIQSALRKALRRARGSFVLRISVRDIDVRVARSFAYRTAWHRKLPACLRARLSGNANASQYQ